MERGLVVCLSIHQLTNHYQSTPFPSIQSVESINGYYTKYSFLEGNGQSLCVVQLQGIITLKE